MNALLECAPRPKKTQEGILASLLLLLFGATLSASFLSGSPLRQLFRGCAMICAVAAAWIAARFLLRSYVYRIEPREEAMEMLDFTVTECFLNRRVTVCRIGMEDIERIEVKKKTKKEEKTQKSEVKTTYCYTGKLFFCQEMRLVVRDGEMLSVIRICSDEALEEKIKMQNSNICLFNDDL